MGWAAGAFMERSSPEAPSRPYWLSRYGRIGDNATTIAEDGPIDLASMHSSRWRIGWMRRPSGRPAWRLASSGPAECAAGTILRGLCMPGSAFRHLATVQTWCPPARRFSSVQQLRRQSGGLGCLPFARPRFRGEPVNHDAPHLLRIAQPVAGLLEHRRLCIGQNSGRVKNIIEIIIHKYRSPKNYIINYIILKETKLYLKIKNIYLYLNCISQIYPDVLFIFLAKMTLKRSNRTSFIVLRSC